ncbi:LOW QUALITY PROTEIN: salicylate carboxymethyltransferase-like [Herrania umbratica]|uniref:LOW QUALITY PROTEIN: salicylate carboxymethyltransferase-like n=1 Tax=Herrania umbratica TaxID=108875 RepID=A0A6J0ZH90_9ROSI|nr:LOW QUALITY PROTEIN: salicylate carboxymethyltransferase-like [Herrania umbratica]
MEVIQVLHMKGGVGETSYANSPDIFTSLNHNISLLISQKVLPMTKPITEESMTELYCSTYPAGIAIADLGCSSRPNAFFVVSEFIKLVDSIRQKLGQKSPEYQVFLNDFPGNDFNTIFRSLPSFQNKLKKQLGDGSRPCFFTGVPGSFYDRLFRNNSLHFVHSSYSLHWLSHVPGGLESKKGNIYMASTSPPDVLKEYYEQFQQDFLLFLKCRSEELVDGGRMVLTLLGRRSDDPSSKECCYIWELLAMALNDMVFEGLIEEEKLISFNIPKYTPSPAEVKSEVLKERSFTVHRLEVNIEVNWNACQNEPELSDAFKDGGYSVAKCMRAVAEPLLASHFGEAIIDEVFRRYRDIVADRMSKEKPEFVNVTISLIKG